MDRICEVQTLGVLPFPQAYEYQAHLARQIALGEQPPTLLLLEHPHTYTFGRRGQPENLLWNSDELEQRDVQVVWTDRGGDVTYHGPGQLVGYPLIPLARINSKNGTDQISSLTTSAPYANYVGYLRQLEQTLILALERFNVRACQLPGLTGVWVKHPFFLQTSSQLRPDHNNYAKIASIGVKIDALGVTRHGFALNVNPDMSYWRGIVACGIDGCQMVSLAEILEPPPTLTQVSQSIITAFSEIFGYTMVESMPQGEKNVPTSIPVGDARRSYPG